MAVFKVFADKDICLAPACAECETYLPNFISKHNGACFIAGVHAENLTIQLRIDFAILHCPVSAINIQSFQKT